MVSRQGGPSHCSSPFFFPATTSRIPNMVTMTDPHPAITDATEIPTRKQHCLLIQLEPPGDEEEKDGGLLPTPSSPQLTVANSILSSDTFGGVLVILSLLQYVLVMRALCFYVSTVVFTMHSSLDAKTLFRYLNVSRSNRVVHFRTIFRSACYRYRTAPNGTELVSYGTVP